VYTLKRLFDTVTSNAYVLLVLAPLLWGGNAVAGRMAAEDWQPFTLTSLRWLLAMLILTPFAIKPLRQDWPVIRQHVITLFCLGGLGMALFNLLMYLSLTYTTAINVSIEQASMPAVIMLVTHQPTDGSAPRCLLGRSARWPSGVFSTLAGFVEPGESLEQAVQREVMEEVAIVTDNARYIASQPWPFPRSIMLGFEANALTTDIQCDPTEIADAKWFTAEELKTFGTWGDDAFELQMPRTDSIARFLINHWLDRIK